MLHRIFDSGWFPALKIQEVIRLRLTATQWPCPMCPNDWANMWICALHSLAVPFYAILYLPTEFWTQCSFAYVPINHKIHLIRELLLSEYSEPWPTTEEFHPSEPPRQAAIKQRMISCAMYSAGHKHGQNGSLLMFYSPLGQYGAQPQAAGVALTSG